jgi:hypothetical protein
MRIKREEGERDKEVERRGKAEGGGRRCENKSEGGRREGGDRLPQSWFAQF